MATPRDDAVLELTESSRRQMLSRILTEQVPILKFSHQDVHEEEWNTEQKNTDKYLKSEEQRKIPIFAVMMQRQFAPLVLFAHSCSRRHAGLIEFPKGKRRSERHG